MFGIFILSISALVVLGITVIFTKRTNNVEKFNVANRSIGATIGAISIAANWIWAPALFISAERAYLTGISGVFWFLLPNILCLLIFIPFAKRMRTQFPNGITLSDYMGSHYKSKKVQGIYHFQLGGLAVLSASVQLLAGSKIISLITGMPFPFVSVALAVIAFTYAQFSGIKASMVADTTKIAIIFIGLVLLLPMIFSASGGVATLANGFGGISGEYSSIFSTKGLEVFISFGFSTAVGLMSGPFGDQSFWQRTFTIKKESLGKAFFAGAFLFALVPIGISSIGFLAAGNGFIASDSGVVNLEYILAMLPAWVLFPFLFMVIAGLLSVVGSNLCATASLISDKTRSIWKARIGMIALLIISTLIANIPHLTVTHLFLFYGTLRASTLLPTTMTLLGKKLSANGVFHGILIALCTGLPVFAYGNLASNSACKIAGSLITVLLSGIVAWAASRKAVSE